MGLRIMSRPAQPCGNASLPPNAGGSGHTGRSRLERLWSLRSLPPGLTTLEGSVGLASLNVIHHHQLWVTGVGHSAQLTPG